MPYRHTHRNGNPLGWSHQSWVLLSIFLACIALIAIVWWPLAQEAVSGWRHDLPWWQQLDGLLLGNFLAMSLLMMVGADLRRDASIALVGLAGGLAIEGWGTQTALWTYYTGERPPLWILPAWPIAALAWDRLTRLLDRAVPWRASRAFGIIYGALFTGFIVYLVRFVWPTRAQPLTLLAVLACLLLVLSITDHRAAVLTFAAGAGLGYFLERWGTTRECWTYYTLQTPPAFAVLAHGMAAVAFWRANHLVVQLASRLYIRLTQRRAGVSVPSA